MKEKKSSPGGGQSPQNREWYFGVWLSDPRSFAFLAENVNQAETPEHLANRDPEYIVLVVE